MGDRNRKRNQRLVQVRFREQGTSLWGPFSAVGAEKVAVALASRQDVTLVEIKEVDE